MWQALTGHPGLTEALRPVRDCHGTFVPLRSSRSKRHTDRGSNSHRSGNCFTQPRQNFALASVTAAVVPRLWPLSNSSLLSDT
jgi:hypothetical protein